MPPVVKCKLLFQKVNETDAGNELKHHMDGGVRHSGGNICMMSDLGLVVEGCVEGCAGMSAAAGGRVST